MTLSLSELELMVDCMRNTPSLSEMPRRTLADKGIDGPTAAHVIEELHAPLNLAYLTFTTGSSAFQNIVGVTETELKLRSVAVDRLFELCNLTRGARLLFTYAPLVNVFSKQALECAGMHWSFLQRSSRDALWLALCKDAPEVVIGESSFLRLALAQAIDLGLKELLPKQLVILTAGTPLDLALLPIADTLGYSVHDLYGCQEFGWLTLDGIPLRDDISLVRSPLGNDYREIVVGGMPTGDSFPCVNTGHICNEKGTVLTYKRQRTVPEYEVVVTATPSLSRDLIERTARTILRIKSRVVKVSPSLQLGAAHTVLKLIPSLVAGEEVLAPDSIVEISGVQACAEFDVLVEAQRALQNNAKTDPTWLKKR